MRLDTKIAVALFAILFATTTPRAAAQHGGHGHHPATPSSGGHGRDHAPAPATAAKPPKPIPMDELHRMGGVPRGWKFTLPAGDPRAGREVYGKLECQKCHEVKPDFPRTAHGPGDVGPELTGMGDHHPAEYFAQSIVDPNAVIVDGPGFVGADGRSVMPDYRDSLTFIELVDLVAYLKSLGGGQGHHHHHAGPPARERTAGPYRLRLEYHGGEGHAHHHGSHAHGGRATGHLMAFVTDAATGEPVPYLPVNVVIAAGTAPPRTVRLIPMVGGAGFHYGADVTLPRTTTKVTLQIGAAALKTMGAAAGRFGKPVTVSFDWGD